MAICIFISLLCLAVGIFFMPMYILSVSILLLLIMILLIRKDLFFGMLKQLAILSLMMVPIMLIKLFTIQEGKLYSLWIFNIYTNGITEAGKAYLRVIMLFLGVYFTLQVLFPLERFRKRYAQYSFFSVIFLAIDMFPRILSQLKNIFQQNKWQIIERIDEVYIAGLKDIQQNSDKTKS